MLIINRVVKAFDNKGANPDPREDLEGRSPNLGPYTTKGTLKEPPLRDLLFGSSRGSGKRLKEVYAGA